VIPGSSSYIISFFFSPPKILSLLIKLFPRSIAFVGGALQRRYFLQSLSPRPFHDSDKVNPFWAMPAFLRTIFSLGLFQSREVP